jgi:hypothetical protein
MNISMLKVKYFVFGLLKVFFWFGVVISMRMAVLSDNSESELMRAVSISLFTPGFLIYLFGIFWNLKGNKLLKRAKILMASGDYRQAIRILIDSEEFVIRKLNLNPTPLLKRAYCYYAIDDYNSSYLALKDYNAIEKWFKKWYLNENADQVKSLKNELQMKLPDKNLFPTSNKS